MRSFFTKFLSTVTAFVTLGAMASSSIMNTAYADSILLGDSNGDNAVTYGDASAVLQYLSGSINPTAKQVTCMDANQDYVIDRTDYIIINYWVSSGIANNTTNLMVNKPLYTKPNFEQRNYYRHDCSSSNPASYTPYTLGNPTITSNINDINMDEIRTSTDSPDYENLNVVKISDSSGMIASGFLITEHIVATAAHAVYSNNQFATNVTVNIYNEQGEAIPQNLLKSASASKIHIPEKYVTETGDYKDNYDYALIYVTEDLTDVDNYVIKPFYLGVATNEFMDTNNNLTTSGFRIADSAVKRYYGTGSVRNIYNVFNNNIGCNDFNLRMYSEGFSIGGKSGGAVYRDTVFSSQAVRSVLGIVTGSTNPSSGGDTWSDRITPTLLRFYISNPNLT